MNELIERIGIPVFIQIAIECWNSLFLLIMILSLIIDRQQDRNKKAESNIEKVSFSNEIIIFYTAIFLYNLFDILCLTLNGNTMIHTYTRAVPEFAYCLAGAFQTFFFLQFTKEHIAKKNGFNKLKKALSAFQLLQIPCILLLASTPFTKALYYFDEQNYYHRGQLYGVWYVTTVISFIFILFVLIACRKKTEPFLRQLVLAASLIPLFAFIFNFAYTGISFSNISVSVTAMMIFILYEKHRADISAQNAYELEKVQTQLAENRLALEQSKNEALMAQIQPHFINNSLMALRSNCRNYPEIYESITNFTLYLHSHFEALSDTKQITFEQEMENIEAYLALEQQNFGERLKVEYDIECDDFLIPALTVQPLVENAVRHGVGTYEKGGTVQINAYRRDGKIIIEVIDDGSGRSNITQQQKKRKGIGIENVRARLKSMTDGELDIITCGHGTTSRITISDTQK